MVCRQQRLEEAGEGGDGRWGRDFLREDDNGLGVEKKIPQHYECTKAAPNGAL